MCVAAWVRYRDWLGAKGAEGCELDGLTRSGRRGVRIREAEIAQRNIHTQRAAMEGGARARMARRIGLHPPKRLPNSTAPDLGKSPQS